MAGPIRPPTERDTIHFLNGAPTYLGALVSSGTTVAVTNATTATPFNATAQSVQNLSGTLAGKTLLLQGTGAGFLLATPGAAAVVANQSTIPPLPGTYPGVYVAANTSVIILMRPDYGWVQWIPSTGAANLLVWELT